MKKSGKIFVAALLLLAYCSVFLQGFAYSAITEDEMDAFLAEQGVPEIAIQKLPFDLKKQIYLGESQVEVGSPTYGVFTDDYNVEYTLENGRVVMNQQSRSQLRGLLNDEEELANVLLSNEQAEAGQPVRLAANVRTEQDALDARKAEVRAYRTANQEEMQNLRSMPEEDVVLKIRNWVSQIICVHLSYTNSVSRKLLLFSWEWKYAPLNALTDKVAMAWSGNFTAESETFVWIYQVYDENIMKDYMVHEFSGDNFTDYDPNVGIGTDIDIKRKYNSLWITKHIGLIGVQLRKSTKHNSSESAVGRYYHKYVAVLPSGSLGFSAGGGSASISISWDEAYDKAPDAACTFWATTKG